MAHARCPMCGQNRTQRAFDRAGMHQLEVVQLRGLGQGRGFDRSCAPADLGTLTYLLSCLDRARAQIAHAIDSATTPAPQPVHPMPAIAYPMQPSYAVPPCPQCGGAMGVWQSHWRCLGCGFIPQ